MNLSALDALVSRWHSEAERFGELGQDAAARMSDAHGRELREVLRAWQIEALTMEDAVAESGYSRSTLERHLADGTVPNAGEKGSPRIRRHDLPMKATPHTPKLVSADGPDIADEILIQRLS